MVLEVKVEKFTLDDLYSKIVDDALMLTIAKKMKEANDLNTDREAFLNSLLAKDDGILFALFKKNKSLIDVGKFNITRGAHTFEGSLGFSYGACAWVSKEARRAGFVVKMPTKNKSNKKDKQKLTALFMSIEGLERVAVRSPDTNQGQIDIMERIGN